MIIFGRLLTLHKITENYISIVIVTRLHEPQHTGHGCHSRLDILLPAVPELRHGGREHSGKAQQDLRQDNWNRRVQERTEVRWKYIQVLQSTLKMESE